MIIPEYRRMAIDTGKTGKYLDIRELISVVENVQ